MSFAGFVSIVDMLFVFARCGEQVHSNDAVNLQAGTLAMNLPQWFSFSNLFGLRGRVGALQYSIVGIALCVIKYLIELAVIAATCSMFLSPLDFVSPFLVSRERYLAAGPDWLGMAWILWTLPFLWIGVCMSIRRALDSGASPWIGMVILIPFANIFGMLLLAVAPTQDTSTSVEKESASRDESEPVTTNFESDIERSSMSEFFDAERELQSAPNMSSALLGLSAGGVYLVLSVIFSVYVLGSYGAAMFFGAPIFTCAVSAFFLNRTYDFGYGKTAVHSILTLGFASLAFLLLGIEGGICIVMAIPIFAPLGMLGGFIGYSIAVTCHRVGHDERRGLFGCMLLLPCLAFLERKFDQSPLLEARTQLVIEAPIENVWNTVVDFPKITAPPTGILRSGVAYPIQARMEGSGVGAVRYCEFNTGSFVEPITVWDQPHRLSFDVASQPEPMSELSPYRHLHPPHLDGSFRSIRGEFRLIALDGKTTRLEGSTWYKIDIGPRIYWKLWTDWILHRIHLRVLEHVRDVSESEVQQRPAALPQGNGVNR